MRCNTLCISHLRAYIYSYRKGNVPRRCTGRAFRPVPRTPLDRVAIQRSRTSRSTLFFFLGPSRGLGPPRLLGQLFFSPTAQAVGWEKYLQLQTDESCIRFLLQQRHFVAATAVIFCYDQRVFFATSFFCYRFLAQIKKAATVYMKASTLHLKSFNPFT